MTSFSPLTFIPISEKEKGENIIYLPTDWLTKWDLKTSSYITINVGKQFLNLKILESTIKNRDILISEQVFKQLYLPIYAQTFQVHFQHSTKTLFLAPFIGLLTEIKDIEDNPHFNSVHSFCEELEYVCRNLGGLFYVFPLQSMDKNYIEGYFFQEGKWQKANLPIPDVIYNRIHSRKLELSEHFQKFRRQIQDNKIPIFNDRFLSKWEVYDVLMTEEHLKSFTPVTKLYSQKNIDEMLEKYPVIFLKPIHGSQGRNILRIEQSDIGYCLQFSYLKEKEMTNLLIRKKSELIAEITPYINKSKYLIQQGISFVQDHNRLMDFRVLCHKNDQDNWIVTSVVARLSAENQFVSNIARGGEALKPLKALSLYFDYQKSKQLLSFMKELALEISTVISENSDGLTGELGIDIGIDTNGHPWLIEANSKPSKNFDEQEIKIRPSAKAILSYCFKLSFERALKKEDT